MILDKIIAQTKKDLDNRKNSNDFNKFLAQKRDFRDVKKALKATPDNPYRIIAEVKKASPSKGIIKEDFNPVEIAKEYIEVADAMSILTEPHFFQGSLEYLKEINKFSPIPLLRKDFIIDEFQIAEAYAAGADFILLIAKALDVSTLKRLYDFAKNTGLEVLFEIHDEEDLQKGLEVGADIIGFNHRNLETFEMDMDLSKKLIPKLPKNVIVVAESGINDFETVKKLSRNGVDAYLVGEHFMRQDNIKKAVLTLKGKTE
ncbi:indole-3-glycerol phosphate synthase [Nautilia profundicola AmH]|uniref:Indole-3-glycerol phosphate synthase n=1 Tax=Nautilia profundicola (strain ATCC BAA-1463 / DSM 18972 / AmH) TaxID=598659 RepID=TRPC_NAUPA|nr:indole-3-glycerol phosphate synthase TrpC [Nautilia profundicola]B9LAF4.1 RecName: Full=Indole-3-glycerol phosphate synthase; Short=IGPS [Nautilia profundicola AmH]ACM92217.1 indole-3-glycerol phosphate synthase [Nautilia profundicola AmH]